MTSQVYWAERGPRRSLTQFARDGLFLWAFSLRIEWAFVLLMFCNRPRYIYHILRPFRTIPYHPISFHTLDLFHFLRLEQREKGIRRIVLPWRRRLPFQKTKGRISLQLWILLGFFFSIQWNIHLWLISILIYDGWLNSQMGLEVIQHIIWVF